MVCGSVEETLNELLEKEAESLTQATRYERSEARQGYRSSHYDRNTSPRPSGDVTLHMPRLKGVSFETAIIERYRGRESSVEEVLIEIVINLCRNWGGEYGNVAILVVIDVNEDGFREVLGAAEGMKEDKSSWVSFFQWLRRRGLDGVKLVVGDKCMGMLEAVGEVFSEA